MKIVLAIIIFVLLSLSPICAAENEPRAVMPERHRAVFVQYCQKCHGPDKQEGKFRVDDLPYAITTIETAERWQKVLNVLNSGEMPPEEEKQPGRAEKTEFLDDLSNGMVAARKSLGDQHGEITMRRLNRREYKNTLRELLGGQRECNGVAVRCRHRGL